MRHENAGQFDRAVKRSIRASGREPGIAYREMLRDRFLCRVFSGGDQRFILKGGSELLARMPDARATRNVDFATREKESAESALRALSELVSGDLGDFCAIMEVQPGGMALIKDERPCRRCYVRDARRIRA